MSDLAPGDLVHVGAGDHPLDGIVSDLPSHTKAIVAVIDPSRGPVFRTVDPATLSARETAGPADAQLRALIKRTPGTDRSGGRGPSGSGVAGRSGFKRGAAHRSTGR
jgi:hypothetical protein